MILKETPLLLLLMYGYKGENIPAAPPESQCCMPQLDDSPLVMTSYSSMSGLEPLLEAGLSSGFCQAPAGTQVGKEERV